MSANTLTDAVAPAEQARPTAKTIGGLIDELPLNYRHWIVFGVCALAFLLDSVDLQVLGLAAPAITREWGVDAKSMGFVFSTTSTGMLIGSLVFGTAADRFGRRTMLHTTVVVFSVFAAACALSRDVLALGALRFVVGVGVGGLIPISFTMMTEYMPTRQRGRMISLYAIFLPLGNFVAAGSAALILPHFGWQWLLVATAIPGVLVILALMAIPESPRYSLGKGKDEAARSALSWLSLGKVEASKASDIKTHAHQATRFSVAELFAPQYRMRTALIWTIWFGWLLSYFGLVLFLPIIILKKGTFASQEVYYYVMAFAAAGVVGRLVVAGIIDKLGRRPILLVWGIAAAISVWCLGAASSSAGVIAAGLTLSFFQEGGASAFATWTPELYPTHARSTGVGFANGAGRFAAIVSPAVVGLLIVDGLQYAFALFSAGFLATCLATWALRAETKGLQLERAALGRDDG